MGAIGVSRYRATTGHTLSSATEASVAGNTSPQTQKDINTNASTTITQHQIGRVTTVTLDKALDTTVDQINEVDVYLKNNTAANSQASISLNVTNSGIGTGCTTNSYDAVSFGGASSLLFEGGQGSQIQVVVTQQVGNDTGVTAMCVANVVMTYDIYTSIIRRHSWSRGCF